MHSAMLSLFIVYHVCTPVEHGVLCLAVVGCGVQPLHLSVCQHSSPSLNRRKVLHSHQEHASLAGTLSNLLLHCRYLESDHTVRIN